MIEYVMKCERADNEIRLTLPTNEGAKEKILQEIEKIEKAVGFALVTMQKPKKPRTVGADSQNHHLNAHIMQICQETGNDYDSVKKRSEGNCRAISRLSLQADRAENRSIA
jgi:hypothetical protein